MTLESFEWVVHEALPKSTLFGFLQEFPLINVSINCIAWNIDGLTTFWKQVVFSIPIVVEFSEVLRCSPGRCSPPQLIVHPAVKPIQSLLTKLGWELLSIHCLFNSVNICVQKWPKCGLSMFDLRLFAGPQAGEVEVFEALSESGGQAHRVLGGRRRDLYHCPSHHRMRGLLAGRRFPFHSIF